MIKLNNINKNSEEDTIEFKDTFSEIYIAGDIFCDVDSEFDRYYIKLGGINDNPSVLILIDEDMDIAYTESNADINQKLKHLPNATLTLTLDL